LIKARLVLAVATYALAVALAVAATAAGSSTSSRPSAVQIVRVTSHKFDWGDAGIGAAAGIGLAMLATGGGLLIAGTRRARPNPRQSNRATAISNQKEAPR
jgi:hypothetical protein